MKLGEFFVTLGVNAETLKVKEFVSAIGNLPLAVAGGIAALAGIEYKMFDITREAIDTAVAFKKFSTETGLSWQQLQKWQIVAAQADVSADAITQSVGALQRNLAEIRMGRGNIAPFQILGISANQDAFQVLEQLRQKIKGLDKATAFNLVQQMGLSPEMIHVLQLSDREFEKFSKTVVGMSAKQEEALLNIKLKLTQLGLVFRQFTINFVGNLFNGLDALVTKLREIHGILPAIGAALVALGIYFAPVTAAVVGLLLLLEDLAVYFSGGKSVTGRAIQALKQIADIDWSKMRNGVTGVLKMFDKASIGGKVAGLSAAGLLAAPLAVAAPGALAAKAVGSIIHQSNKVDIHIDGSQSPHETAKAAKKEFDQSTNAAALQNNNGGY